MIFHKNGQKMISYLLSVAMIFGAAFIPAGSAVYGAGPLALIPVNYTGVRAVDINEDTVATIDPATDMAAADGDPEAAKFLVISLDGMAKPTNGIATIVNNKIVYTPNQDYYTYFRTNTEPTAIAPEQFEYSAYDRSSGLTSTGIVWVHIKEVNDAPVAGTLNLEVKQNEKMTITYKQILDLCSDVDRKLSGGTVVLDVLTIKVNPGKTTKDGTLVVSEDKVLENSKIEYTPPKDLRVLDSFSYTLYDKETQVQGTVNINIKNTLPVAADYIQTTPQNQSVIFDVLNGGANKDNDGDTILFDKITKAPANGTATIDKDKKKITYTPTIGAPYGNDVFEYQITDGNGGLATAKITVTVTKSSAIGSIDYIDEKAIVTDEDKAVTIDPVKDIGDKNLRLETVSKSTKEKGIAKVVGGKIIYTPNKDAYTFLTAKEEAGAYYDEFTYTLYDSVASETITGTVWVYIKEVNDTPLVTAMDVDTEMNTSVDLLFSEVLTHCSDEADRGIVGNNLAIAVDTTTSAKGGKIAVKLDLVQVGKSIITYTPALGFSGADTFTYNVTDNRGGHASGTVKVNVLSERKPPVAKEDTLKVNMDTSGTVKVLLNDTDPQGKPLTLVAISQAPTMGTATIVGATLDTIEYTPKPNSFGTDTVKYQVRNEAGLTAEGTVTITVAFVNKPPVAVADAVTTALNSKVIIDVLANDSDPDGGVLKISSLITTPKKGTVTISTDKTKLTYTPDIKGTVGVDTFEYQITDGQGGNASALVTVTLTQIAVAPAKNYTGVDAIKGIEDQAVTIDPVKDMENALLTISSVSNGTHGVAEVKNNKIIYTPKENEYTYVNDIKENRPDLLTYTIHDPVAGQSATGNIEIYIKEVNDVPVAKELQVSTSKASPVTILFSQILANCSDVDGDGTPIVNNVLSISLSSGSTKAGKIAVDTVARQVVYTPNATFTGKDEFTYTLSDNRGGKTTGKVVISVAEPQKAPVANPDTAKVKPGAYVNIDVLKNDKDPNGGVLSLVQIVKAPTLGKAVIAGSEIRYTPGATAKAGDVDTFIYEVTNASGLKATANVTVNIVDELINTAPTAADMEMTTKENEQIAIFVLKNAVDPDGDVLSIDIAYSSLGKPKNGTIKLTTEKDAIVYMPKAGFTGQDTFQYRVIDALGAISNIATITVTVEKKDAIPAKNYTNADALKILEDVVTTIDPVKDTGNKNMILDTVYRENATKAYGVIEIKSNKIVYTPYANVFTYTDTTNGAPYDVFKYSAYDKSTGQATIGIVHVYIKSVNDAPVAEPMSYTIKNEERLQIGLADIADKCKDVDGDALEVTVTQTASSKGGTVTTIANGLVEYVPKRGFSGVDTFEYNVSDNKGAVVKGIVTINVGAVGKAPKAVNDTAKAGNKGTSVSIAVLSNDQDPNGGALTIESVTQPTYGIATIGNGNKEILYRVSNSNITKDTFTYTVKNEAGLTATATVTVTISKENSSPRAKDDSVTVYKNVPVTIDVLENDSDVDGDTLKITKITKEPARGTAKISSGKILYTPNKDKTGSDYFEYEISDGKGGTDTAEVSLSIKTTTIRPADMKTLRVNNRVVPDFSPETYAYTVNVLDSNDTVALAAEAADPNAEVNGPNGVTKIKDGGNSFTWTVTGSNKEKKTYKLNVVATCPCNMLTGGKSSKGLSDLSGHKNAKHITGLAELGIIQGYQDGTFKPNGNITRAEFSAVLLRVMQIDASVGNSGFKDVKAGAWHYNVVGTAVAKGLLQGSNGYFRPDDSITREEVATILARALGITNNYYASSYDINAADYYDKYTISSWALDSVGMLKRYSVMDGTTERMFSPKQKATRGDIAGYLCNFLGHSQRLN